MASLASSWVTPVSASVTARPPPCVCLPVILLFFILPVILDEGLSSTNQFLNKGTFLGTEGYFLSTASGGDTVQPNVTDTYTTLQHSATHHRGRAARNSISKQGRSERQQRTWPLPLWRDLRVGLQTLTLSFQLHFYSTATKRVIPKEEVLDQESRWPGGERPIF